jgi:hypothetical protein
VILYKGNVRIQEALTLYKFFLLILENRKVLVNEVSLEAAVLVLQEVK